LGFWKELWTLAASAIRQARGRLGAEREGRRGWSQRMPYSTFSTRPGTRLCRILR
jgi:hypothetical protein